jgi:hypothetical protein
MLSSHKVKIDGELLEKVRTCVKAGGYESVDAFVIRVLEKEVEKILPREEGGVSSRELIRKRLQGLGYIE